MFYRTYHRTTPLSDKEITSRQLFAKAASEVKRRMEAGDTRRRGIIFKEVYVQMKAEK